MNDLEKYSAMVKLFARQRSGQPFYNGSADHAAAIVQELFATAKHSVDVLSDDLDTSVYGRPEVVQEVARFLQPANHKLRLLIGDGAFQAQHPWLGIVRGEPNAEVRRVQDSDAAHISYNFAVSDTESYRYEPDGKRREAVAAFGDPRGTEGLTRTFDAIWHRAHIIDKIALSH